jgi:flagellin
MAFDINTNIASLQAQQYLRTNSNFQGKTINEVTSGLRIVSSGDDAAGLAIANGYRSDQAVIGQGVRNANDGLSQLQIADGGISNISQLLDRARTLATQSATGTFTGEMALPDGTVIPGTGKSFALTFSTTARWDGDQLVDEYVFWDSALMAQQIGLA